MRWGWVGWGWGWGGVVVRVGWEGLGRLGKGRVA